MASPIMASDLTRSLRAFMRSEVKNSKIYSTIYARPCIILKLQNSLVRLTKLTEDCPAFPSAKLRKIQPTVGRYFLFNQTSFFQGIYLTAKKYCFYKPYFFVFKIRILSNSMYCKSFSQILLLNIDFEQNLCSLRRSFDPALIGRSSTGVLPALSIKQCKQHSAENAIFFLCTRNKIQALRFGSANLYTLFEYKIEQNEISRTRGRQNKINVISSYSRLYVEKI